MCACTQIWSTVRLFVYTQTKHQQNIKQIVEDKDNQITKLATDLKSKEEETEGLKHNVDIKMVNFMCSVFINLTKLTTTYV